MNILAIDPGSTSTKLGVLHGGETLKVNLEHPRGELERFPAVLDQLPYRLEEIERCLERHGLAALPWQAVVGRGGLLRPVEGGVYRVTEPLLKDLRAGVSGEHAANLGGILADRVASRHGAPAFVVDPPVLDEMWPVARVSGLAGVERRSMFHALNQKAAARDVARELGRPYGELSLVVVHMGGGITAGAHYRGRVVDVNNGLNGDGPFSPERTGGLPVAGVLDLLERGVYGIAELKALVARRGGMLSYLGTVDLREVEARVAAGEAEARLVFDALVYQVAKEVGALAAALDGKLDGIVLTGGLARSQALVGALTAKVGFLAPVFLRPGEFEIEALIGAARRVLEQQEAARDYPGGDHEDRG